jgi:hypothetical protein
MGMGMIMGIMITDMFIRSSIWRPAAEVLMETA